MRYFLSFSLLLVLMSCETSMEGDTNVEMGSNKEIANLPECNCDSLQIDENYKLKLDRKAFTGNCFLNYPASDQKYLEKQILDGTIHGKITYFDKTGEVLFSETYKDGTLLGNAESNSRCNCTELEIKESENKIKKNYLNESLFTGNCEDFFPNSDQLYLESSYKDGLLNGFTVYYNRDGSILMMQDYKDGILIEDIVPQ